jgi:hypothetical protein
MKLDAGKKHLMRLAVRDAGLDGWAKVSSVVWPAVASIPDELMEKRPNDNGGHVRLTQTGVAVLEYS